MSKEDRILIGVDGGGTKCRAAMVDSQTGRRIERCGGPANVTELSQGLASVTEVIAGLIGDAGAPAGRPVHAHLGLAGACTAQLRARIAGEISARFGIGVSVSDDQVTTLTGALGAHAGTVASVGTGSFVARQDAAGRARVVGGWGLILGDQAAGAWIGRRYLQEAMLARDGLRPADPRAAALVKRLGGPGGVIAFCHSALPADFAALAPEIVAAAEPEAGAGTGDDASTIAGSVLRSGADYLLRALRALDRAPGERICLTGGLGPAYEPWLRPHLDVVPAPPEGTALDGALALALREERSVTA